jgi:polar amino acid transport system permease protein
MIKIALALLLFALLCTLIFTSPAYQWSEVWNYRALFFRGWLTTIALSIAGLILSCCIGLLLALMKRSSSTLLQSLSTLYIEVIRGTPFLVQILFLYYVAANSVGLQNRYLVGIIALSLFSGAYIAEIFRSGIDGVAKSQLDSAKAIGFTPWQTYRLVIIPQALRYILPPLTGQFASLIKDSSLLSVIGISELTYAAEQINSATYSTLESFFPLGLAYLALTLPISLFSKYLEKRFHYAH